MPVPEEIKKRPIDCILVDEAQFLSPRHVEQLFAAVMNTRIPCICYGLRTDFRGEGDQVVIDNNATVEYEAVCGQCFLAVRRTLGEVPLANPKTNLH